MRIDVTQEDIDAGLARVCDKCPIALAIARVVGGCYVAVSDDGAAVYYDDSNEHVTYQLPEQAFDFMFRFDFGHAVQPFSFDLPLEAR